MAVKIIKRQLTDKEVTLLIEEVKKFFSPIVGYKDKWKQFDVVYVATENNNLVGVCGVEMHNNWLMLHPFVVLKNYHGQGIGSLLMGNIVKDNKSKNIFIGSQNLAVKKIAKKLGFRTVPLLFLPLIVKWYLFKFTLDSCNTEFIHALLMKRSMPRGKFYCFIKYNSQLN